MLDELPHHTIRGRGGRADRQRQRLRALAGHRRDGLPHGLSDDVEFVHDQKRRVPPVEGGRVGRERDHRRVVLRDDQPVGVDVGPVGQLGVQLDHAAGHAEDDVRLSLVGGDDQDLGRRRADEQFGDGQRGRQGRLAVRAWQADEAGPDAGGEGADDDLPLPRTDDKRVEGADPLRDDDELLDEAQPTSGAIGRPSAQIEGVDLDRALRAGLHWTDSDL